MVPLWTRSRVIVLAKMFKDRNILLRMVAVGMFALIRNSRNLYRHLRARGVPVIVWVLNDEEEFQEALDLYGEDIDGMMTDCPSKLSEFVNKN